MSETRFEIVEHLGTLGEKRAKEGLMTLELNMVKWYGAPSKLDLRWWNQNTPGKGVTFSGKEAKALRDVLNGMQFGDEE